MQRAPKISVFPSKVLQSGNMIRLPVGVAYPAHTGGTPIASLIPASVVRTQHANLSHDTITQFTAEKFDEVSVHQAQLSRPGGRVALDFNNGVFEADGAGVRRNFRAHELSPAEPAR